MQIDIFKCIGRDHQAISFALECIIERAGNARVVTHLDMVAMLLQRRVARGKVDFKRNFQSIVLSGGRKGFAANVNTVVSFISNILPSLKLCSSSTLVHMVEQVLVLQDTIVGSVTGMHRLIASCFALYPAMRKEFLESMLAFLNPLVPTGISQIVLKGMSGLSSPGTGEMIKAFLFQQNFGGFWIAVHVQGFHPYSVQFTTQSRSWCTCRRNSSRHQVP